MSINCHDFLLRSKTLLFRSSRCVFGTNSFASCTNCMSFLIIPSTSTSTDYYTTKTRVEPSCTAKGGGKDKAAVTAVAFAPALLKNDTASAAAVLSIGMESGLIELWSVCLPSTSQSGDGTTALQVSPQLLFGVPRNLCHMGAVTSLSFRPREDKGGGLQLTLASCGMDNGVRIYSIQLS